MTYLAILVAIAAEFTVGGVHALRSAAWSLGWGRWVSGLFGRRSWWHDWLALAVLLGVPVAAVAMAMAALYALSPFLGFVAGLAVLLLMIGPEDLGREVEIYRGQLDASAPAGEFVRAARGTDLGPPTGDGEYDAARVELAALALAAERAWFQPLFWFFVLGPAGAVLYRLCANLRRLETLDSGIARALASTREALEWLPARLSALALGIAGTLVPAFETAREAGLGQWGTSAELVARTALAAADNGRIREVISGDARVYRINAMYALLQRALIVWLAVLAIGAIVFD